MNMVKLKIGLVAAAASGMFAAGAAQAADNVTVTLNATIIGVCKFFTAAPVITIANTGGNIDPSLAGPATGQALITYRCTNGTAPIFTVPATATVTCTTAPTCGATTMTPTISSANTGNGTGLSGAKNQTLTVTAQITQANYQDMQVGSYSGTMLVSVAP